MKQGCVIAPDVFNCVFDDVMRRLLSRCNLGIQLGEYQLTDLDYADDIAIIASSACVLRMSDSNPSNALKSSHQRPTQNKHILKQIPTTLKSDASIRSRNEQCCQHQWCRHRSINCLLTSVDLLISHTLNNPVGDDFGKALGGRQYDIYSLLNTVHSGLV